MQTSNSHSHLAVNDGDAKSAQPPSHTPNDWNGHINAVFNAVREAPYGAYVPVAVLHEMRRILLASGAVSTEQETPTGFYAPDPMPRWKRWLQQTFFPQAALLPGDDEIPGFAPGEIFTGVVVSASWADRLRLLVSGRMTIDTRHRADVHVSRVTSRSMFNVAPPTFLQ